MARSGFSFKGCPFQEYRIIEEPYPTTTTFSTPCRTVGKAC